MNVKIHRGASEIGGSCVEVRSGGKSLLVDVGLPLETGAVPAALPDLAGSDDLLGVLISHGHPDHYGMANDLDPGTAIFMGEAGERILAAAAKHSRSRAPRATSYLRDRSPIQIGPFRVTPYLVDHSAYDSYAFLIEAEGNRLFYSGDLRAHGRKPGTFRRLVDEPPTDLDAMLMEGTTVGREDPALPDEHSVEAQLCEALQSTHAIGLAMYSPQNVDRLVSVFKAARGAGRELVLDLYAAEVVAAVGNRSIPQPGWEGIRVYVTRAQRASVIASGDFSRITDVRASRIFLSEMLQHPGELVLTFRPSMVTELGELLNDPETLAAWLMWPGYLEKDGGSAAESLRHLGIKPEVFHASGHAHVKDLRRLAVAMQPRRLVPIHTSDPEKYSKEFDRVERHPDGVWWNL